MPTVDLVDETFIVADRTLLVGRAADPVWWRTWWPDLELTILRDRGADGLRWEVTGALTGSCELWLEPVADGVVVHYYLRADPASGPIDLGTAKGARRAARLRARRARSWKRWVWAWKDELEHGRVVGARRSGDQGPGRTCR